MTDTVYKIPVKNVPQRFEISLSGADYIFECRWFSGLELWVFSLLEAATENVLILHMPLVTGTDLLRQFAYLKIPGVLITFTIDDTDAPPALATLGNGANLYYIVES